MKDPYSHCSKYMNEHVTTIEETKDERTPLPERTLQTTKVISPAAEDESLPTQETKKVIFRASHLVWFVVGVIEALLGFRILLKLIEANPGSGFTQIIYALSWPFASPFFGIVRETISGYSVMEWSTVIAMAVYAVVGWGIIEFFQVIRPIDRQKISHAI